MESFLLNKEIYEIPQEQFEKTIRELSDLLEVKDILGVQVRKLSLGQRMKCELIAVLLHRPKILFLDEPTIGLDVVMQKNLRKFIREYNLRYKATIILTSHYMGDVEELCDRVIIIDHGKILYDGLLSEIVRKFAKNKLLSIVFHKPVAKEKLESLGEVKEYDSTHAKIAVPIEKSNHTAAKILEQYPVEDLNIEEPDIETIIRFIFSNKKV